MAFKEVVGSYIILGAFVLAVLLFSVNFQNTNGVTNQSINSNPIIANITSDINSSLMNTVQTTNAQRESFESEDFTLSFGSLIFTSIIGAGKAFAAVISLVLGILASPLTALLGIPPIFAQLVTSIIIISVIFLLWRTYKSGG